MARKKKVVKPENKCPACEGTGDDLLYRDGSKCTDCNGTGKKQN